MAIYTGDAACSYFAFSMGTVCRFLGNERRIAQTDIFPAARHSSKEIKVNGEKWNRRMRWPCWTIDRWPDAIERRESLVVVTMCPCDTLFTSQCAPLLPRACFRKEIKCVDEEREFNEIPARFQRREMRKSRYLFHSSLSKFHNYFISQPF